MSRRYDVIVQIGDLTEIAHALEVEYSGERYLRHGESEKEYAERIRVEIWNMFHYYVDVSIIMTYLEDLPYTVYKSTREDYEAYKKAKQGE